MKSKKRCSKLILKTQERPRHELQIFKVRCSLETAFYAFVEAHDAAEAEIVAEGYCRERDSEGDCFWDSEASYKHSTFEAEEA
jgi:hypothetical protein